jgi:HSP20 family protein
MKATGTAKAPVVPIALPPTNLAELQSHVEQLQAGIARRAFELFEARNCEHGHDWEDWFRAQSELMRPVSIAISESKSRISLRVNVLGFEARDLRVSVAPDRVLIVGDKPRATEKNQTTESTSLPTQLLRTVELPTPVQPDSAHIQYEAGVLRIELPKAIPANPDFGPKLV